VLRICRPLIGRETDVDAAVDILDEAFAAAA
jgi:4-aminobutyrate aminotransferase-like enzyme